MYPRLKSWAFPRKGFRPTTRQLVGGLHANNSLRGIILFHGQVLPSGGLCPTGVLGYGSPLSKTEALTHTALILGGLERGCFTRWLIHLGETAASSPSFGALPGRSVRGRITPARTPRHVRPQSTTMLHTTTAPKRTDAKPTGHCAVAGGATDALLPRLKSWVSALFSR
jgi:hypothetical protein